MLRLNILKPVYPHAQLLEMAQKARDEETLKKIAVSEE